MPAPWAGLAAVLNIESRGAPAVVIRIGATESDADIVRRQRSVNSRGYGVCPSLPWEVQISRHSNNQLLLARTINTLPQWLVLLASSVTLQIHLSWALRVPLAHRPSRS